MTNSKFLKVRCTRCKNIQIVFGKSSMPVKCKSCKILLVKSRGGKAKIKAFVTEVL